jgi:hypothetical protein
MKRLLQALSFVIVASTVAAVAVLPARPGWADWTDRCWKKQAEDSNVRRLDAQGYAAVAEGEGYEWGGGCWNNNNKDDTPGAPDSDGEGPDCSGFVFKTWELRNTAGDNGFTWYQDLQNVHGAYVSDDFHSPVGSDPFFKLPNKNEDTMMYMDAFAKNGHVGMLWTTAGPTANTDPVIEAKSDALGTDVIEESYRSDSAYVGVSREDWTPDCWPHCKLTATRVVVVP